MQECVVLELQTNLCVGVLTLVHTPLRPACLLSTGMLSKGTGQELEHS